MTPSIITQFNGEYRFLSNFFLCPVTLSSTLFNSVEHAYQSAKSHDPGWKTICLNLLSPGEVKKKGKRIALREDWESVKISIMLECLVSKFSNPVLKGRLNDTGKAVLQEGNTWGDKFWGVDLETGEGENILGQLIMLVRENMGLSEFPQDLIDELNHVKGNNNYKPKSILP